MTTAAANQLLALAYGGHMRGHKKSWSEMSPLQRKAVVAGGVVELVVTAMAASDLYHRDASQVRGPKAMWFAAFAVQPLGPLGYLLLGRK
jgi:hypothetical protein